MAKAKTISLLLNDGTLKGVISMEDSSWNKGELYSAPRESVDDLILSDACSRYGVYLLLSEDMVYIGQASDLAKRIKQHLIGKSWWERVVILTTSDDSLNRSDIDYIEANLISKASEIGRLDCDIVGQKDIVSKRRKEDDQRIEDEKIKKKFWENPQTREILELRLNDAEKQVVQEENLQFTRAVNNGKQTKKIFISHKEVHKLYGQFIVDVLETYGVDVVSTIIFTGDRRLGVPQGKDIYDYLKDCFREDLMVIFLFSKAFYDSNICISEAGAAWATNQNCMNVVIDISFSDIEKPSNNALSSIKFQQIRTPDQTITVTEFFKTIIEEGLHLEYDESKLQKALNDVLETDKYSDQKIDFPATFLPKRKFLPVPRCSKCHNIMLLTEENGRLKYVCSNVSCDECYEAVIN